MGILAAKRSHGLKKGDRIALWGMLVSAMLGITALTVDIKQKQNSSKEERDRINDELARQHQLLRQVQRGQYAISDYGLKISFTVSADNKALRPLIARWNDYLKSPAIRRYDSEGYSPDKKNFITLERGANGKGKISTFYVDKGSELFPEPYTPEHEALMPIIYVYFLKAGIPNAGVLAKDLTNPVAAEKTDTDLALFMPLNIVERNDNMFVRLTMMLRTKSCMLMDRSTRPLPYGMTALL
jgi:hypothetical protein